MSEEQAGLPPLEELDCDGAIRETAERVDGHTRASFLRKAGIGGGLVVGGGALAGAVLGGPASAVGASAGGDLGILNFALVLEYLEASFYADALQKGALHGETKTFANVVAQHEMTHAQTLASTIRKLGGTPVPKPSFNFRGTTSSQSKFQQTSMTLEDTGVKAYAGQAANIQSKQLLTAAATILAVEARHASWIREIIGNGTNPSPAPAPFNPTATKSEILSAVKSLNFITSSLPAAVAGNGTSGSPSFTG